MDASPTKAWLVAHRHEPQGEGYYRSAFSKRPGEELYDLRADPQQTRNLADQPSYIVEKSDMARKLLKVLVETRDPRVTDGGTRFDLSPFSDPEKTARQRPPAPSTATGGTPP